MGKNLPRLVIAGLSGDSGKTIVSSCLLTALRRKQRTISVFKKGPDYIDAAWLSHLSQAACRNLDTYLIPRDIVYASFIKHALTSDIAIIEGNRGLFDGRDDAGTHSTAELAKLLMAPVILVVDCTKMTRTTAALVRGCMDFDRDVKIAGVILNNLAGQRHERIVRDSVESACGIPVMGAIPKLRDEATLIPGRHLGLVTPAEFDHHPDLENVLGDIAERYLDVAALLREADTAHALPIPELAEAVNTKKIVKVGFFKDSVFTFYYPENLEALEAAGADLIAISALDNANLPDVDALYIGGGFPETQADRLCANQYLMDALRCAVEEGLPVYAECGGLIYLSRSLTSADRRYPMANVFPVELVMRRKPVGHGYTRVTIDTDNPFFKRGTVVMGHEFHYSDIIVNPGDVVACMNIDTGVGLGNGRDGLVYKNVLACYTHIHASGTTEWAPALVKRALEYRTRRAKEVNRRDEKPLEHADARRSIEPDGLAFAG